VHRLNIAIEGFNLWKKSIIISIVLGIFWTIGFIIAIIQVFEELSLYPLGIWLITTLVFIYPAWLLAKTFEKLHEAYYEYLYSIVSTIIKIAIILDIIISPAVGYWMMTVKLDPDTLPSTFFGLNAIGYIVIEYIINLVIGIFWAYVLWRLADDTEASLFKAVAIIVVVSSILNANGILVIIELIILWMAINEAIRKIEGKIYSIETT
jgi:hypothetical protein